MHDEITYPFPNFNGATVEVWEWISNFISHFSGHRMRLLIHVRIKVKPYISVKGAPADYTKLGLWFNPRCAALIDWFSETGKHICIFYNHDSLQNKIWNLPDRSPILRKFIYDKEGKLAKSCRTDPNFAGQCPRSGTYFEDCHDRYNV